MKTGLVTVVVPVYKTEKYLNRCVESIVNQTYRNLEILLIDDGSPDACPQMCDAWALKDSRIRVIHKENAGLGMARNTGIANATGEYICFFDSDDYLALDMIQKSYRKITEKKADVVVFGFFDVDKNGNIHSMFVPQMPRDEYKNEQIVDIFLPELIAPNPRTNEKKKLYMSAWSMMFSLELVRDKNWKFVSEREIIAEDIYSLLAYCEHVKCATILSEPLYYYCANDVSLSRVYKPGRYQRVRHFYTKSLELCQELGYGKEIQHRLSKQYLGFTIAAIKQERHADIPRRMKRKNLIGVLNDDVLRRVLVENKKDNVKLSQKILFWAMRNRLYIVCSFLFAANDIKKKVIVN